MLRLPGVSSSKAPEAGISVPGKNRRHGCPNLCQGKPLARQSPVPLDTHDFQTVVHSRVGTRTKSWISQPSTVWVPTLKMRSRLEVMSLERYSGLPSFFLRMTHLNMFLLVAGPGSHALLSGAAPAISTADVKRPGAGGKSEFGWSFVPIGRA